MSGINRLPVLETARLVLRPFASSDAGEVRRLAGEREVAATTGVIPHPYPEGAAEQWIASHADEFVQGRRVTLAITRSAGELLGAVSLLNVSATHRRAELGYWVGKPYWSNGYGTEAVRAMVGFGFGTLGLHRVEGRCFRRNRRSARVLEKAGMAAEGCLREWIFKWGRFEDMLLFGLLAVDWSGPESGGRDGRLAQGGG